MSRTASGSTIRESVSPSVGDPYASEPAPFHHPLYLRKDEKIKPFDVESYLTKLGE